MKKTYLFILLMSSSIHAQTWSDDVGSISIYDYQGRLIRTLCEKQKIASDLVGFTWNGLSNKHTEVEAGTYFISMNCNGKMSSHPIMKR